jgi:hypothetical protein
MKLLYEPELQNKPSSLLFRWKIQVRLFEKKFKSPGSNLKADLPIGFIWFDVFRFFIDITLWLWQFKGGVQSMRFGDVEVVQRLQSYYLGASTYIWKLRETSLTFSPKIWNSPQITVLSWKAFWQFEICLPGIMILYGFTELANWKWDE